AVLLREQRVSTLGDGQLAAGRHGHALLLVLVDAADDHGGAVRAQQRHTFSKRSSPSSRLIELTMALPWQWRRASSITAASVESIMSGTFTLRVSAAMKRSMSAASSRSGLARHTSSTWAVFLTWARPISAASSTWPAAISSLTRREAMTFVRSPTKIGRLSSAG